MCWPCMRGAELAGEVWSFQNTLDYLGVALACDFTSTSKSGIKAKIQVYQLRRPIVCHLIASEHLILTLP
jgi:hypothetical protein